MGPGMPGGMPGMPGMPGVPGLPGGGPRPPRGIRKPGAASPSADASDHPLAQLANIANLENVTVTEESDSSKSATETDETSQETKDAKAFHKRIRELQEKGLSDAELRKAVAAIIAETDSADTGKESEPSEDDAEISSAVASSLLPPHPEVPSIPPELAAMLGTTTPPPPPPSVTTEPADTAPSPAAADTTSPEPATPEVSTASPDTETAKDDTDKSNAKDAKEASSSSQQPSTSSGALSSFDLGALKRKHRKKLKKLKQKQKQHQSEMTSLADVMFAPPGSSPFDDEVPRISLPSPQWDGLKARPSSVVRPADYKQKQNERHADLTGRRDSDEFAEKREAHLEKYGDLAELTADKGKQAKFYKEHNELIVEYLNSGLGDLALLAADFLASVGQLRLPERSHYEDIILLATREARKSGVGHGSDSFLSHDSIISYYEAMHLAGFEITKFDVADLVEFFTDPDHNESRILADMIYALRHTSWAKIAPLSAPGVEALAKKDASESSNEDSDSSKFALFSDVEFERYVLNAALFAAAEENETSTALRLLTLFRHAKPFDVRPTYESFSFVLRALAHSRNMSDRERLFPVLSRDMAHYDVKPDLQLYNNVMAELCSGCMNLKQPKQLLDLMLRNNIKADRGTMASLIWAAQYVGTTQDVKYLLTKIPEASEDFEKVLLQQLSFLFGKDTD